MVTVLANVTEFLLTETSLNDNMAGHLILNNMSYYYYIDYTVEGQMLLVVIDAHSKWIEVEVGKYATAEATNQRLQTIFARFGIPETVMTDNGPCFSSRENNGVVHSRSAHIIHLLMEWRSRLCKL